VVAKKKTATPEKRQVRGSVLGVSAKASPAAGPAAAAPVVESVGGPSGTLRMLAILLFSLPALLIVAALVPLNFEFVPYKVAYGWEEIRVPVALCGLSLLVVEGFVYLLMR
jgi:hypothetical protein